MKIAVVGAGILGVTIAHALLDGGHEVIIVDEDGPGAGASRGNAGWIAHTDILPLATWRTVLQAPRYLLDPLGPLAIRPGYLLRLAPWLVRFMANGRPSVFERGIRAIAAIQLLSMPAWSALTRELGLEDYIRSDGTLTIFDSIKASQRAMPTTARQREFGITVDPLSGKELHELEPGLSPKACAALFFPQAAHVSDPLAFTEALYAKALQRGAHSRIARVNAINRSNGLSLTLEGQAMLPVDKVVVAAGAWSKALAASMGDDIPLDTERGYNVHFNKTNGILGRPALFDGYGFVASPLQTGMRVGGGVEFAGLAAPPNHRRTIALYRQAQEFLPDLPPFESGETWMGLRPSLPDSLPVIGQSPASGNVIYAFGHGHHGLTQAAATARLIADVVAGRTPPIDLHPYRPGRF
jgi:D-amino-acid dehydrogenase